MYITVSKCHNFEAKQKAQKEEVFFDNEKYIRFGAEAAPECYGCGRNYDYNGGVPCLVSYNPEIYKGGKYKNRPELAARRVCKMIARKRRKENYKRNYAERQEALRDLRANLAKKLDNDLSRALDSISVTWETFGQAIATAARKVFGGMK